MKDQRKKWQKLLHQWNVSFYPPPRITNEQYPPKDQPFSCLDGGPHHDWCTVKSESAINVIKSIKGVTGVEKLGRTMSSSYMVQYEGTMSPKPTAIKVCQTYWATQMVCLDCSECKDGIKKAREHIKGQIQFAVNKERTKDERHALAKKLWAACDKGVK